MALRSFFADSFLFSGCLLAKRSASTNNLPTSCLKRTLKITGIITLLHNSASSIYVINLLLIVLPGSSLAVLTLGLDMQVAFDDEVKWNIRLACELWWCMSWLFTSWICNCGTRTINQCAITIIRDQCYGRWEIMQNLCASIPLFDLSCGFSAGLMTQRLLQELSYKYSIPMGLFLPLSGHDVNCFELAWRALRIFCYGFIYWFVGPY